MKTRILQILFIVGALMLWCCTTDPDEMIPPEITVAENPDYAIIRSLGFDTKDIIDAGDTYIVEGDIVFDKNSIDSYSDQTRQARYQYLISSDKVSNIKVYVKSELQSNDGMSDNWYTAAIDALAEWNNIPSCNVYFYVVSSASLADVIVQRNSEVDDKEAIARAYYPSNGNPGHLLEIGFNYDYFVADQKKYVLVHEYGHILGLAHTDYVANKEDASIRSHITGTPVTETSSIMDSHGGGRYWNNSFTNGDIAAIQALYGTPIWSMLINGPSTYSFSPPSTYTLNVGTNLIDQSVLWYINDVQKTYSSFTINPTFTKSGSNTLKARINYEDKIYETNKVITVPDIPKPVLTASKTDGWPGETITITASGAPTGATYSWRVFVGSVRLSVSSDTKTAYVLLLTPLTSTEQVGVICSINQNGYEYPGTSISLLIRNHPNADDPTKPWTKL